MCLLCRFACSRAKKRRFSRCSATALRFGLAVILIVHCTLNAQSYGFPKDQVAERQLRSLQADLKQAQEQGNQREEADATYKEARIYLVLGQKERAVLALKAARDLYRQLGDPFNEASTLNDLGTFYASLEGGDKEQALEFLKEALPIYLQFDDYVMEAATLKYIGSIYESIGGLQKALDFLTRALALYQKVEDHSGEAATREVMGMVYSDLDENGKALDLLNQNLPIWRQVKDSAGEYGTLNDIGMVYFALGKTHEALNSYQDALSIATKAKDHGNEARTLANIGELYFFLGQQPRALQYFSDALHTWQLSSDRNGEAMALINLGRVYSSLAEKQNAHQYYIDGLVAAHGIGDPLAEGAALESLMQYYQESHQFSLAVFFGKQAVNSFQHVRQNIHTMEKETQQSFLKSKEDTYRDLAELLITERRLPEALEVLNLIKDEEYAEFTRRVGKDDASAATSPVSVNETEAKFEIQYQEIGKQLSKTEAQQATLNGNSLRSAGNERQLADANKQVQVAAKAMRQFFSDLSWQFGKTERTTAVARELKEPTSPLQAEIRELSLTSPGVVAVWSLVRPNRLLLLVVTPQKMVAREYPIQVNELRNRVSEFRTTLQSRLNDPAPTAWAMYKILIGPIENDLQGASTLMWSLDDVLRYIPMAALYDGSHYLVDKYRMETFTLASHSALKYQPDILSWRGLGMGVSELSGNLKLTAVADELHAIIREQADQQGLIPGKILLDEGFTQDYLKRELQQHYQLIHIASHFTLQAGSDRDSFLLLGGTSSGHGDERLTLEQIATDPNISFADTELLTLSACNTAMGGSAKGKDVDVFGDIAQRKGARAVLATLWRVSDASTALLMQNMYRFWMSHPERPKAEALRQAQRTLLHPEEVHQTLTKAEALHKHPYYWAPFVLFGNWR